MSKEHLENVDFEFVRYANCWEDPEILLEAFDIKPEDQIVSIASGGDNCFSLASAGPKRVLSIDVSKVQLYVVQLKKEAIRQLSREEFLEFAGFEGSDKRIDIYKSFCESLDRPVREYWDQQLEAIKNGIIHLGKFERYFQLFRETFLLQIHDQQIIDGLFAEKSDKEQLEYYNNSWFDPRWETMHSKFFGKDMLGEKGRDPEFLKQVKESVSESILLKEVAHLKSTSCQNNPFLFYILNNRFDERHLPHYVRKENYNNVKENIDSIVCEEGLLQNVLTKYEKSAHFNLSNIFEYMTMDQFKMVGEDIVQFALSGANIAYWNFMVYRSLPDVLHNKVSYDKELSEQLTKKDCGYFYDRFELDHVK